MAKPILTNAVVSIGPLKFRSTLAVNSCVQCAGPTNLRGTAYLNKTLHNMFRHTKDSRFYIGNATLCSSNCAKAALLAKAFELKFTFTDEIQEFVESPNDNTHFSTTEILPYKIAKWVREYIPNTFKSHRVLKELELKRIITISSYGPKDYPYVLITAVQPVARAWYTTSDSNVQFFSAESFNQYKLNLNLLSIK